MQDTSLSLLDRLSAEADDDAWRQLVDLYTPLLKRWLVRYDVQDSDADDLIQDVLLVVTRELPRFQHNDHPGAFRSWLRGILVNRLRNYWRSKRTQPRATGDSDFARQLDQLADDGSGLSRLWNEEHDRLVLQRLLNRSESQFAPSTWQAFRRLVLEAAEADAVAKELGLTPNAVYIAKSRVLSNLRRQAAGLVE